MDTNVPRGTIKRGDGFMGNVRRGLNGLKQTTFLLRWTVTAVCLGDQARALLQLLSRMWGPPLLRFSSS